jgi:cytochrome c oxidase subunit II
MTNTRDEFHELFGQLYLPVTLAVGAIVATVVLVAAIRYRRKPGREPSRRSEAPVAESVYALVIAVVVGLLLWATFTAEAKVDKVVSDPGLRVDVTAFKWQWRFDYVGEGVPPSIGSDRHRAELVVPADTVVQFRLTSRDVIHALWIPAVKFKRDAFPNRSTTFDLVFDQPGSFPGRCAEFCGLEHADMTLEVRVVPPAEFDSWLAGRRS